MIPGRGEDAVVVPGEDDAGAVHYHFPVEIEVGRPREDVDPEALAERALWRLAEGLGA